MGTTATPRSRAPAAATDLETDGDDQQRKRNDTHDGLLCKFEFDGETEEVKLTAEEKLPRHCVKRARKRSLCDRTWHFEAVNITSVSQ